MSVSLARGSFVFPPSVMPTIYQRFLVYRNRPGSVSFSKTKYRRVCNLIAQTWDRNHRVPWSDTDYVESIENGVSFSVRNYPDHFTAVIDRLIYNCHLGILKHPSETTATPAPVQSTPPPVSPPESAPVKKRKRFVPPAFSGKKIMK